jgi:predicted dehydrogenase
MTKEQKLGVCIVGCGDMGSKHAERWNHLVEAQVVAVVDTEAERAEKLARTSQLDTWYTDYQPAVSLAEVDVVSVCVPTGLHAEISIFAANQGKHILCEKPIALTLLQAEAMIEAARQKRAKLGLGFMRRYSPVMTDLKAWLSAGQLGRPVMYHAVDARGIRPKREMHDVYANGGPIIDMGVHLFDGWRCIFDSRPVEVFAQGVKLAQQRPELGHIEDIAYDTATIVVRYASGDIGSFVVSWGLPPGVTPSERPDQIFGPEGLVQVGFGMSHQEARVTRENGNTEAISISDQDMYQLEIADFARCILEEQPPKTSGEDGKAALRVALAAMESIQTGQPVFFEESPV